jgi:hypothetical protein
LDKVAEEKKRAAARKATEDEDKHPAKRINLGLSSEWDEDFNKSTDDVDDSKLRGKLLFIVFNLTAKYHFIGFQFCLFDLGNGNNTYTFTKNKSKDPLQLRNQVIVGELKLPYILMACWMKLVTG